MAPADPPDKPKLVPPSESPENRRNEDKRANIDSTANPSVQKTRGSGEFEFCEVCRLNHDQGRRHKYCRGHARAVSALLGRIHKKLADIRFFLRHPSPLRPEHAHLNRLWCPFCAIDLQELDSPFACRNAIYHLASSEHNEKAKEFLRKHGGGKERVESFSISEADLLKWEKGCEMSNNAASANMGERTIGPSLTSAKDIQYESTSRNMTNFETKSMNSLPSTVSSSVMPLQSVTNENQRKSCLEFAGTTVSGSNQYGTTWSTSTLGYAGLHDLPVLGNGSRNLTGSSESSDKYHGFYDRSKSSFECSFNDGVGEESNSVRDRFNVLQPKLVRISLPSEGCQMNVHTGAPPPWLEIVQGIQQNMATTRPYINKLTSRSSKIGKSKKLNPKRVGAAWAEKRKAELEMEKRGEIIAKSPDANWLPNFGRVWQTGTRKESKKEFELEKRKHLEDDTESGLSLSVQPYISKRMRKVGVGNGPSGQVEESSNSFLPEE